MGNLSSSIENLDRLSNNLSPVLDNEMEDNHDDDDDDSFEGFLSDLDQLFRYQEDLLGVLNAFQYFVARQVISPSDTNKMPVIKKRPDLSVFLNTDLYNEIKILTGNSSVDKVTPTENWSLFKILQQRENGFKPTQCGNLVQNEHRRITNLYIPNHNNGHLMSLESQVFCGKFNKDGSRLLTASQDNFIRVYDSSKGIYNCINSIEAPNVYWSILDIDFSPDGTHFVYSTLSENLYIAPIHGPANQHQWINFNLDAYLIPASSIYSVRFSPCGEYLIAGSNHNCIFLYDRNADVCTKIIRDFSIRHTDVNAVSYLNNSPNVFVSGCDEGIIKLWDSRCISDTRSEPVSVFVGHYDGITYIDSRGDGRHILSNSKDQSIKIWDLRNPSPTGSDKNNRNVGLYNWDYRWDKVPKNFYDPPIPLDDDTSIMTYRGHRVTRSLIRAKFSPAEQTGQRYIYTGCSTGRVVIYDVLTGFIKQVIDGHKNIVRDVDWHPVRNEIVSSSWDTYVNLNVYKSNCKTTKRRYMYGDNGDEPLRRSRRIALRNSSQQN